VKKAVGRWEIEFDPQMTARRHEQIALGWDCECAPCRNFFALDQKAFSPAALELFECLGVDYRKPVEIYHNARLKNDLHDYGGWFHFIGTIESGTDAWKQFKDSSSFQGDLESLGQNFRFGFSNRVALIREPFRDHHLVQLEFNSEVPWVLSEPGPT
jgi:hypothetical protein